VIEGEKIAQIVAASEVKAVAGDTTIDLPDATLTSRLDRRAHAPDVSLARSGTGLAISTAREALHGARNARVPLEAGFTTVRNLGGRAYADIALRDAITMRATPSAPIIGSGPRSALPAAIAMKTFCIRFHREAEGVAAGVEAVQHQVREVIKYGAGRHQDLR